MFPPVSCMLRFFDHVFIAHNNEFYRMMSKGAGCGQRNLHDLCNHVICNMAVCIATNGAYFSCQLE